MVTVRPINIGAREASGLPILHPSVNENMRKTSAYVPMLSARNAVIIDTDAGEPSAGLG